MRVAQPSTAYVRNIRLITWHSVAGNVILSQKRYLYPSDLTELEHQVYMARKKSESSKATGPQTESERLREENLRLRKALAYSELRNEALHELLKIGREQYGIDLLKKAGAKR